MNTDSLVVCEHCGSHTCYKNEIPSTDVALLACLSCGFISNTVWKREDELFKTQMESFPELYKSLVHEDINKDLWIPNLVNIPHLGMVFIDGTNEDDCEWVGIKSIKVSNKEKIEFKRANPLNKNVSYKTDLSTKKGFGKHGYLQALEYIGITL